MPSGRRHQADELELPWRPRCLSLFERVDGAAAGGEHRVEHVHARVRQPGRQPLVVVDRRVRPPRRGRSRGGRRARLAAAAGSRRPSRGRRAAPARPRPRRKPRAVRGLERGLDLDLVDRQLARDLDGHDRRGLEQRLAEVAMSVSRSRRTVSRSASTGCSTTDQPARGTAAMLVRHGASQHRAESRDRDPEAPRRAAWPSGPSTAACSRSATRTFWPRRGRLKLRVEAGALGGELIAYGRPDSR